MSTFESEFDSLNSFLSQDDINRIPSPIERNQSPDSGIETMDVEDAEGKN